MVGALLKVQQERYIFFIEFDLFTSPHVIKYYIAVTSTMVLFILSVLWKCYHAKNYLFVVKNDD